MAGTKREKDWHGMDIFGITASLGFTRFWFSVNSVIKTELLFDNVYDPTQGWPKHLKAWATAQHIRTKVA